MAKKYLDYWERLAQDPGNESLKDDNEEATPTLVDFPPASATTAIFSPRHGLDQLRWYGTAMAGASGLMCFTGAFGINKVFLDVFKVDEDYLRYVFLEKWGVSATSAAATEKALSTDFDIQVAVGATLPGDTISHWLAEQQNTLSRNIKYTHTKFMLVDPLGEEPIVITGSANFSDASTSDNDENMLVIRGDTRVADIYLGEFMRLWRHHNYRYIVTVVDPSGEVRHNYLRPNDSWVGDFYLPKRSSTSVELHSHEAKLHACRRREREVRMALKYGVLKGTIAGHLREADDDHYQVLVHAGKTVHRIACNVKSSAPKAPSTLLFQRRITLPAPIISKLVELKSGFTNLPQKPGGLSMDYVRSGLVSPKSMEKVPPDEPGADNDLKDRLEDAVVKAVDQTGSIVYAFGAKWGPEKKQSVLESLLPGSGIHDIHMNQGNSGKYKKDNGVYQDGCLIFSYPNDKWLAFFFAFQSRDLRY